MILLLPTQSWSQGKLYNLGSIYEPYELEKLQDSVEAYQNSIWETYGKYDRVVYQDYSTIDFESIPKEALVPYEYFLPISMVDVSRLTPQREAYLAQWMDRKLQLYGVTRSMINQMTVKQMLDLSFKVSAESILYCLEYGSDNVSEKYFINVVNEQGVCGDYAWLTARFFSYLKKLRLRNSIQTNNVRVVGVTQDILVHGWNMIVIFYPDKLVYTFMDMTGHLEKYGMITEGYNGRHLATSKNFNLGFFYEQIGDYEHSFYYYEKGLNEVAADPNSENWKLAGDRMMKLAAVAEMGSLCDEAFKYYEKARVHHGNQIHQVVKDYYQKMAELAENEECYDEAIKYYRILDNAQTPQYKSKIAFLSHKQGNFAYSLYHYEKLFMNAEDQSEEIQLDLLHNIFVNLNYLHRLDQFGRYIQIAFSDDEKVRGRMLTSDGHIEVLQDLVSYYAYLNNKALLDIYQSRLDAALERKKRATEK